MSDRTQDLDDAAAEALLSGRGRPDEPLTGALLALQAEADRAVPEPSAALATLLAGGVVGDELARRRRAGRTVLGVVVAGGTTLALSGVAAANDALPGPAQHAVTSIVNDFTPFHIAPQGPPAHHPSPTDPSLPPGAGVHPTGRDDHGRDGRADNGDGSGTAGRPGDDRGGPAGGDENRGRGSGDGGGSGGGDRESGGGRRGSDDGRSTPSPSASRSSGRDDEGGGGGGPDTGSGGKDGGGEGGGKGGADDSNTTTGSGKPGSAG